MTIAIVLVCILALICAAVWLHHLFEGEWLPADLLREWKLSRATLAGLDSAWSDAQQRSEIVVSLTTIPSRMEAIDDTIKSLLDQSLKPARIVINVPRFSRREQVPYVVPERLRGLAAVEIRECDDWGPATKIIPCLLAEASDQPILVVDDDRIYPRWMIELFAAAAKQRPDDALTLAGWVVPHDLVDRPTSILSNLLMRPPVPIRAPRLSKPRPVDVLLGVMGYLVRPRFFDRAEVVDFSTGPEVLLLVDDVRTSALCKAEKYVIPAPSLGFIPWRNHTLHKQTALGRINSGPGGDENRHNSIAIRHYADVWRVGGRRGAA